jgi:small subunit ribosomal protein S17
MNTSKTPTMKVTVVKKSSAQTIRVSLKIAKVHPIYKKRYSLTRHYLVHDEAGTAEVGQEITIVSCRPISKLKHWKVA